MTPITVRSGDSLQIAASLTPQPDGCAGAFAIDWELPLSSFSTRDVKTHTATPADERIEMTLDPSVANFLGNDYIHFIIRDGRGTAIRNVIVPLRGGTG
jgi:hypothetical protein